MPLAGNTHLVTAISVAAAGLWLVFGWVPEFLRKIPNSDDYFFMVLMALSVICLWSSARFIILNRRQSDALVLLIILVPIILASLYMILCYVTYVLWIYHRVHRGW